MLLHPAVSAGAVSHGPDAGRTLYQAAGTGETGSGRSVAWANEASAKTAPKSALGKALHYLREQWPYLVRYLEDGRLELSNNRAERSIKPFVMGRKNWLFSNTPAGAQSSAVIYSLIETAKENGLD